MNLSVTAIVTNEYNQILLAEDEGSKMWGPPGGPVNIGELPLDTAARETQMKTGIRVYPVRLAAAIFTASSDGGTLHLIIRCLQRGGQLTSGENEGPQAGFFPAGDLPAAMNQEERRRVELAVHQAGPIVMKIVEKSLVDRVTSWLRPDRGAESGNWRVDVWLVAKNQVGEVAVHPQIELPNTTCRTGEAPWEAAGRLADKLFAGGIDNIDLSAIFVHPERLQIGFVFHAGDAIPSGDIQMVAPPDARLPAGSPSAKLLLTHHEFTHFGLWQPDD